MKNLFSKIFICLIFLLVVGLFSCVVTDTIEFEDKTNSPPRVENVLPSNGEIYPVCLSQSPESARVVFSITLWDPNSDESDQLDAYILTKENPYTDNNWAVKVDPGCSVELLDTYQNGYRSKITCEVDVAPLTESEIFLVKIILSDRGFVSWDTPKSSAQTVSTIWVLEFTSPCQ